MENIFALSFPTGYNKKDNVIQEDIKKLFSGEILSDEKTLDRYSRDYSIFRVKPRLVAFPRNTDDIKKLVEFAGTKRGRAERLSITARSAGTDMTGGPLNDSIIIDFTKRLNRIKYIGPDYAIAEPGVYFRNLEKQLAQRGLFYPAYPASKDLCALGGMISNNSGGEKTLSYGKTQDYVRELRVILSDGNEYDIRPLQKKELQSRLRKKGFEGDVYRKMYALIEKNYDFIQSAKPAVSKNSSGYSLWDVWDKKTFDLTKLIVGSQGTLGIITEAKLGVVKIKRHSSLVVVFLKDLAPLAKIIVKTLEFKPESLESFDDKTLSVAMRFLPGIIKSMGGNFFKLILQFLPEVLMALRGGFPKMILLSEFTSNSAEELARTTKSFFEAIKKFGVEARIIKNDIEAQKYWTIRHQSFNLLHDHSGEKEAVPFIDDVIVRPEYLPEFLPKLNAILDKYKDALVYTIAGHPVNGNFHIIPIMDLKNPSTRSLIPLISDEVYDLVLQYKGSITAEHNDGLIRTPYLKKMYGEKMTRLFAEVKKIFDKRGIFNPGKKVGGDLEYSMDHIV